MSNETIITVIITALIVFIIGYVMGYQSTKQEAIYFKSCYNLQQGKIFRLEKELAITQDQYDILKHKKRGSQRVKG